MFRTNFVGWNERIHKEDDTFESEEDAAMAIAFLKYGTLNSTIYEIKLHMGRYKVNCISSERAYREYYNSFKSQTPKEYKEYYKIIGYDIYKGENGKFDNLVISAAIPLLQARNVWGKTEGREIIFGDTNEAIVKTTVEGTVNGKVWDEEFDYSSKIIKVILENKHTNKKKTIKCVMADTKAHSFNVYPKGHKNTSLGTAQFNVENGLIQTGIVYPNASNDDVLAIDNVDGSVVEFCTDSLDFVTQDYKLIKLVVIDL